MIDSYNFSTQPKPILSTKNYGRLSKHNINKDVHESTGIIEQEQERNIGRHTLTKALREMTKIKDKKLKSQKQDKNGTGPPKDIHYPYGDTKQIVKQEIQEDLQLPYILSSDVRKDNTCPMCHKNRRSSADKQTTRQVNMTVNMTLDRHLDSDDSECHFTRSEHSLPEPDMSRKQSISKLINEQYDYEEYWFDSDDD